MLFSTDGGESFAAAGVLEGGTVIGSTMTVLPDSPCTSWDRHAWLDVELLADRDWLERRSEAAVLAGANLALVGNELIQFRDADALGPRRFRLRGLLRGRRGTEAAAAGHMIGERFVLVDQARMLPLDFPFEALGRQVLVRPAGVGDQAPIDVPVAVGGRALRPLAPVHLRAKWRGDDLELGWIRRSRAGFGWTDFVDAPLAEDTEAYLVEVRAQGRPVRQARVAEPRWVYALADRRNDGDTDHFEVLVAQLSAAAGPGSAATIQIDRQGATTW
jgi:hypothetical protein